ncbi:MAG: DUF4389 domain-containing protein [Candidatus Micrarchaeota archaeon]
MKTLKYSVDMPAWASRRELLVRLVYWIPLAIVSWVLGMVAGICVFAQIFHILFTKKMHPTLHKYTKLNVEYQAKMNSYFNLLIDERPPIIPEGA